MKADIERSLIATLLNGDKELLNSLELKEELFSVHLHKLIIKCVQWLLSKDKGITDEIVFYYISKNNQIDVNEWFRIVGCNPFASKNIVDEYMNILKEAGKGRIDEI